MLHIRLAFECSHERRFPAQDMGKTCGLRKAVSVQQCDAGLVHQHTSRSRIFHISLSAFIHDVTRRLFLPRIMGMTLDNASSGSHRTVSVPIQRLATFPVKASMQLSLEPLPN